MQSTTLTIVLLVAALTAANASAASIDDEYDAARDQYFATDDKVGFFADRRDAKAPDGYALPFGSCTSDGDGTCGVTQSTLALELPFAYRGAYQAQRNIAYCLYSGCEGALQPNRILGCAWRLVIASSGSARVDETDTTNLRTCSTQLDDDERSESREQARKLFRTIYARSLPKSKN